MEGVETEIRAAVTGLDPEDQRERATYPGWRPYPAARETEAAVR